MRYSTPSFVTAGLRALDALWAELFEGGEDLSARTGNNGGADVITDVFELRAYCWCDGEQPGHANGCPPNFRHLSSGFTAEWYKHAERGEQCWFEQDSERGVITALEWARILTACLTAAEASPPVYRVLITGSREYGKDLVEPGKGKKRYVEGWETRPNAQRQAMTKALRGARERAHGRPMLIVHGDAAGADTLAARLARRSGVPTEAWPALWRREDGSTTPGYDRSEALRVRAVYAPGAPYNRAAGPERNRAMVAAGADEVLAFIAVGAGNRGTQDCIAVATAAGIPVRITEA